MKINKDILEWQLFTYNSMFKSLINSDHNLLEFNEDKTIKSSNLDYVVKTIQQNVNNIKSIYENFDVKNKKYRNFDIISIFIYILWKYVYTEVYNKKKYWNYEYNKFKSLLLNSKEIVLWKKYFLPSEIIDIILFYQYNNWFLNYPFLSKLYNINNSKKGGVQLKNEYNLYIVDYHDFQKSEINYNINLITDYFEKNKKRIFFDVIIPEINKLSLKEIKKIESIINKKKSIKKNQYFIYFPLSIKSKIIKSILIELDNPDFKQIINDNNIEIKKNREDILVIIITELIKQCNSIILNPS